MHIFFFNDTATTEIYTLSLHDALPISPAAPWPPRGSPMARGTTWPSSSTPRAADCTWMARRRPHGPGPAPRSEEHTSELQSRLHLVCRLLLEKKKKDEHNVYTESCLAL